jgi:hypothetical protein
MVQRVFISFEPCYFHEKKELENSLFSMILIESKYILHVINEIIIMIGPLRDLIYTYKYIKNHCFNMNNYSRWRGMTVYYVFNTYIIEDYLGLT